MNAFKTALNNNDMEGKIIGADCSELAPALYMCDEKIALPKVSESNYIEELIKVIKFFEIKLIVPTIDTELSTLSRNKEYIENETDSVVLVSSEKVIDICENKILTSAFFEQNGFKTPEILNSSEIKKFPVFIKPLNGSSSVNTFIVNNEKELLFFSEYIEDPLIQEYILGEEYTIDVCLNFDSTPVSIVPRKRIATRGGEILKGQIIKDRELIETTKKMLEKLNAIGHITIQCIKNEKGIFYLEINARYGGGVPISIKSGANSPEYIIKMIDSKKNLTYRENYLDKMIALRYDQAIYLDEKGNVYND
ncbi:ATP-grasp domain-containing protein [Enterococcus durans]|nr:ATP-grasp domain-containing protein [Enterococcus durans]